MEFYPGFPIEVQRNPLGFCYADDVFGPKPEVRRLCDIRSSLQDPNCSGPEELYAIVMDVGLKQDRERICACNLLFGAVTYAAGTIGKEPVRSQGHIHAVSPSCGMSTPEVYEIWEGEAIIYMQQFGEDNPGNCYVVHAKAGEVVIVPPNWVHATINADVTRNMTFGAWCVRDYGFEYQAVRSHHGIAYFPQIENNQLIWNPNPAYHDSKLIVKNARTYQDFRLEPGIPIYTQFQQQKEKFLFVSRPMEYPEFWKDYQP